MIEQLEQDCQQRPGLFIFRGAIPEEELNIWLNEQELTVPNELKSLWCSTGGGDFFESETILAPLWEDDLAESVRGVNDFHYQRGMPAKYLIFHTGLGGLTVVALDEGTYSSMDDRSYELYENFASLNEWYSQIHAEYAERYSLE